MCCSRGRRCGSKAREKYGRSFSTINMSSRPLLVSHRALSRSGKSYLPEQLDELLPESGIESAIDDHVG